MSEKKPISPQPKEDATNCEAQRALEMLAMYLADLTAEEHLKRASKNKSPQ